MKNCIDNIYWENKKQGIFCNHFFTAFKRKKYYDPLDNLQTYVNTAKFERLLISKQIKQVQFFPSANCIYHKRQ